MERKAGKIKVVDLLASELSIGDFYSSNPKEKSGIWIAYKFEFGVGTIFKVNQHNEIGVNFILLKFARDKVSPNISGSGILLKYRFENWQIEGGVESRRERMFGYLMPKPVQYILNFKYLIDGNSNFGIRLETLRGNRNKLNSGLVEIDQVKTLKIFYGKYF